MKKKNAFSQIEGVQEVDKVKKIPALKFVDRVKVTKSKSERYKIGKNLTSLLETGVAFLPWSVYTSFFLLHESLQD